MCFTNTAEKIFNIQKRKKLGRKKKSSGMGKHNKFCYDNLIRKAKTKLFKAIIKYINKSIKKYKFMTSTNNIEGSNIKEFPIILKLNKKINLCVKKEDNKKLLNTKLKDIFSNDICEKYVSYRKSHNKNIILILYKENLYKNLLSILDKTLFECLEHFRGSKKYSELNGLEKEYPNIIKEFIKNGETEDYIVTFEYFLNNIENYLNEGSI